ncbi:hypothetical protein PY093_19940 [Cytobacillus sp. S13-E01]|uniref:hypothetical protein n=1 Tax=Cytobacillus sp. S13-E01 TaxID=3031326 RepID=UPI0023D8A1C0|nr:hypothetical protein [Cytobacillus sp. S13-E01]MDF0728887.1 hypothetical protein [Cytobacillus sp. S13-E01]
MNFLKYEEEMNDFLNENYRNLKRAKIANSEFALKELLQTEQADINNYALGLVSKIINEARRNFVETFDAEKGYEIGKSYKSLVKAPKFQQIDVNFKRELSISTNINQNNKQHSATKRIATLNYAQRSEANKYRSRNLAIGAGVTTISIAIPASILLTPTSVGASILIGGISAIVVAGIVYTVISYVDNDGIEQSSYVVPTQTQPQEEKPITTTINDTKKIIDQESMSQLLDIRKAEAKKVLLRTIQDAKKKYEQIQAQFQTV